MHLSLTMFVYALCSSNACICAMLWGGGVLLHQYNNDIQLNTYLLIVYPLSHAALATGIHATLIVICSPDRST